MSAGTTARKSSLRENTREACVATLTAHDFMLRDAFLLGFIASAAEHRTAADLRAIVLGVLDARAEVGAR